MLRLILSLALFGGLKRVTTQVMNGYSYPSSLTKIERLEYESYVLSAFHAAIVTLHALEFDWKSNNVSLRETEKVQPWCFYFMMGYFLNDIIILIRRSEWSKFKWDDFTHHVIGFLLGLYCVYLEDDSPYHKYIPKLALIEFSTVFLSLGFLLRGVRGKKRKLTKFEAKALKMNVIVFCILFFMLRVMWMPYIGMQVLQEKHLHYSIKMLLIVIQGLQFYWFRIIFRNTIKFLKQPS